MNFLKIKNQSQQKAEIYIYGDIVNDSWNYGWEDDPNVYPLNIKKMLDEVKGKELDVYINSGGGHVFAGAAISKLLARHDGKTRAIVDGMAASAASVIAFGCDEVVIPANGYLMIHKPIMGACFGDSDDMLKTADTLDHLQEGIMKFTQEGVSREEMIALVNAETWFIGETAKEVFRITVEEKLQVIAVVGEFAEKLASKQQLKNVRKKEDEEKTQKQKGVEIALALAGLVSLM